MGPKQAVSETTGIERQPVVNRAGSGVIRSNLPTGRLAFLRSMRGASSSPPCKARRQERGGRLDSFTLKKNTRERPARGAGHDDSCVVPGDRRAFARSPPSAAFLFSCPPRIPARAGQGASAARWASSSRRAVSSPVAGLRAAPPRLPDPLTVSAGATGRAAPSPLCFPKGMGLSEIRSGRLAHRRNGQKTRPPRR